MNNISLGEAWAYVATQSSYWVWLVFATLILGFTIFFTLKKHGRGEMEGRSVALLIFAASALFLLALLLRPCEVAANTTVEQAARGVYIW